MTSFEELVQGAVRGLRDLTLRETVELGVLHGFCVDVARENQPDLFLVLSSIDGLAAFSAHLSRMPDVIEPIDCDGSRWRFVEDDTRSL